MPARESPLAALHEEAQAKMVEYAGWRLPLQYTSVAEEVQSTRRAAGLFDISHMGNLHLLGPGAVRAARNLLTRNVSAIPVECSAYALLCNDRGRIRDDLFVMVISEAAVGLVVNAVNHDRDVGWLKERLALDLRVVVEDLRERSFGVALQGPRSEQILRSANIQGRFPDLFATFSYMRLARVDVLVSRTGYTGEDGFEIFGAARDGPLVWRTILDFGREHGLVLAGLAARDVLRQEMGYPLWGQDIDEQTTPLEAGLGWAIDWEGEFIGRAALEGAKANRQRIGFTMQEPGIARHGAAISLADEEIGVVTSGTYSHNLGAAIGQGYVAASANAAAGAEIGIEVRARRLRARVERLPLIPKKTRKSWRQTAGRRGS